MGIGSCFGKRWVGLLFSERREVAMVIIQRERGRGSVWDKEN